MRVGELIEGLGVRLVDPAHADVRICDITEDSRTVLPGSLFIARQGDQADGRRFIPDAARAGAAAILTDAEGVRSAAPGRVALLEAEDVGLAAARVAECFYGDPSRDLTLIGVTGTNGKTTVAWLVHQILNACGVRCGLVGTVCVDDGNELAPASLTTPPAIELSRTLGVMRDAGCAAAVLEVSSHALEQHRVSGLSFDAAIFTNLTGDHLDYHETMSAYAAAKARLFTMLPADGLAIVNVDDPASRTMLEATRARPVRCSLETGAAAEAGAETEEMSVQGTTGAYRGPWGEIRAHTRLVGRHNVMNLVQAIAAVHGACGVDASLIETALPELSPPPGRLEPMTPIDAPLSVFVDYAHSDGSLDTVLRTLRELLPDLAGRLCVVFGCGGDRDRTKRPRMGRVAATYADCLIITSDNPRSEDPMAIIAEVRTGLRADCAREVIVEPDRARAIKRAVALARAGDVVLIAGKGHEDYQILSDGKGGTVTRPFDDRAHARAALRARSIEPLPPAERASKTKEDDEAEMLDMDWVDAAADGAETEQV